jgi:hypothetical protein
MVSGRQLVDGPGAAEHRRRRRQQAVVRPEERRLLARHGHEPSLGADAGIHDREHERTLGQVLHRAHERERPRRHLMRWQLVGQVDHGRIRRDRRDDCLAHADEFVGEAVIGQKGDDRTGSFGLSGFGHPACV